MCWVDSKLSSLMHWARDSRKQIQSYTLMLKPVLLTPLRFHINLVEFAIANCYRKFLIQIFHKQNSKHLNKILGHTRTLLSVFHSIRLHDFFSHKILVTFFLHRTEPFVLYTRSLEFCSLNFVHVKDTTKQWMILDSVG